MVGIGLPESVRRQGRENEFGSRRRTDSRRSGSIERDRSPGGRSFRLKDSLRRGWDEESPALFISRDYGKSWQKQVSLPDVPRRLWVDPNSASDGRTLFLASTHAIAVVSHGGVRSLPLPTAMSDISMGFGSGLQATIYATSEQGIYVSNDTGVNWRKSDLPGAGAKVRAIATSLHHPETAYASYDNLRADGESWMGVARTTNSGG